MKKVLSFVLSVAMVICLMPAMAFAADDAATTATATGLSQFSDADSIQNKEAVAVLVGLGIIDGMGDGTFQPAGNLTRAQASKLVATLVKSGDKSEIPAPAADPFTDVAKTYWGAGAIKFGVENDYINGMGDGTFHPEDQVTTAQLVTMLEKVLGFAVSDVNYNWPENAMAIAKGGKNDNSNGLQVNLLKGVTKGAGEALNRDEAAQVIFNALISDDVVKSTTTGSGNQDVDGSTKYSPVKNDAKLDYQGRGDTDEQLVEKYFPKASKKAEQTDDFGRTATKWKNGRTAITDEVTEAAVYTYTEKKAEKDVKATLKDYDLTNVAVWTNGDLSTKRLEAKDVADLTGNGKLVEIYPNEKDTAIEKIVVVDYTPAKVTGVNSVKAEINLSTNQTVKEDDDVYSALSGVAKKDVVLLSIRDSDKKILDAYVPAKAEGTIANITTKKVDDTEIKTYSVAGTGYEAAATVGTNVADLAVNADTEYTVYLDKYNYLKEADKVDETTNDQYMLVNVVYEVKDKYGSPTLYVKGVLEDGTVVEDLKVSDAEGNAIAQTSTYNLVGKVYKYKETAEGYEFTDAQIANMDAKDNKIDANAVRINGAYVAGDAKMVTVTGKKNAGELSATAGPIKKVTSGTYQCVANDKEGRITTVFVESASASTKKVIYVSNSDTGNDTLYVSDSTKKSIAAKQIEYYTADVDGEAKTMYIDKNANVTNGFYGEMEEIGQTSDGTPVYALSATAPEATAVDQKIAETNGGTVISIGQADYELGEVEVIDLRNDDQMKASGVAKIADAADLVDVVGDKDTTYTVTVDFAYDKDSTDTAKPITQIYITDVAVAAPGTGK